MAKRIPLISLLLVAACSRDVRDPNEVGEGAQREAKVDLKSAEGIEIEGNATLQEETVGVRIKLEVSDTTPGEKGVHIHEKGDCSDIAGKSMGAHFSPEHEDHALPSEKRGERHLGDMGNIVVQSDGRGKLEFVLDKASLREGDANSLIGRALVVHEGKDLGSSAQPAGGAGKPIACGVIEQG